MEKTPKEAVESWRPPFRHCRSIRLQELRKITKNLSQNSRPKLRKLNPGSLDYVARALTTEPRLPVTGLFLNKDETISEMYACIS